MAHTTHHTTPHTTPIALMNRAIDKHAAHRRRQHTLSQSYNSREAYDTRRAKAYITELWQTHHTPIANAIHQHADKPTPRWQYHQLPPSTAQATPTPATHTEYISIVVIDETGQGDIYTGTLTATDTGHTLTFTRAGRRYTLRLLPPHSLPPKIHTPYGDYTADEIYRTAISSLGRVYMLDSYTTK